MKKIESVMIQEQRELPVGDKEEEEVVEEEEDEGEEEKEENQ